MLGLAGVALTFGQTGQATAATEKPAQSCDVRGGRTLLANTTVRFYFKGPARERRYFACTYADRRSRQVAQTNTNREIKLVGAHDRWMFWIVQMTPKARRISSATRYAGISIWDVRTGRMLAQNGAKGYVWTAAAIGPGGIVAGIGDGEGTQVEDLATGEGRPPVSAVLLYDPAGRPLSAGGTVSEPRVVTRAPLGALSDFGLAGDTIVWRQDAEIHTAPLKELAEYPGTST